MDLTEDMLPLATKDATGYTDWILRTMERWLEETGGTAVDPDAPFTDSCLDSVAAMRMLGMLEILMDQPMDPTLFNKFPSPRALGAHLGELASLA